MCWKAPKPTPPPPPPPEPPRAPLPEPEPVESEVNPQIRRAKSQKDKSQYASGTRDLRIKLDPPVATGGPRAGANKGGLNT